MRRIFRLTQKRDFANLFKGAKRIATPCFQVMAKKNSLPHPRFAFVISKNTAKSSTARNRLRRRAREWVRKNGKMLMVRPVDIVFVFKREAVTASRKHFYEELNKTAALLQHF